MIAQIRMLHTADLHIGTQNYGRIDHATGLHSRILDFLTSLDELVSYAIRNDFDIVLISGDIFKSREPDVTQQSEFAKRIKKLSDNGIVVYLLIGNHDVQNTFGKATSIEIYEVLNLEGVYVRKQPSLDLIKTKRGVVQIVALPYVSAANLSTEGVTIDEVSLMIREKLYSLVDSLTLQLNPEIAAVLVSHYAILGADSGSEKGIMLGKEVILPVSTFSRQEYEYVAMGHLHKHQVLLRDPPIVYSGSLDRVDFSEADDDKGFVEIFVKKGETHFRFIKLHSRPFKTISVDASDGDGFNKILMELEKAGDLSQTIVKIKVTLGNISTQNLNESELYKIFRQQSFYFLGIEKKVTQDSAHLRHPGLTERIDARRAISEYISKKEIGLSAKRVLIQESDKIFLEVSEELKSETY